MKKNIATIGIGSNLNDPESQVLQGIEALEQIFEVKKKSSLYKTQPLQLENEKENFPWYVNAAVQIETELSAPEILTQLKSIEKKMGRVASSKWASRIIDFDLLFFNDETLQTPELSVPHPELHRRRFVLIPVNEIASDLTHPTLQKTVGDLLKKCEDPLQVELIQK